MASYDALRHVSIGQYIPTGSPIHRLDPRAKLLGMAILTVAVVIATSYVSNVVLLLCFLAMVRLARLPLGYILSSIKPAIPLIIVFALLQLLFYGNAYAGSTGTARVLLSWGPIQISTAGLRLVIVSLLRFLDLLLLTSLLTNTTTTGALTHGVENLLRPFSVVGLPGHEIAFAGAIALRFVPILGEQLESIAKAQASRGVRHEAEGRWHFVSNTRRLARLIVPLFVDAFRRSEEMALAMQARCYRGGWGRTRLVELAFAPGDYLALGLATLIMAAVVILQRFSLP